MTWRTKAACRGMDPNLFYPEPNQHANEGRAVCAECPVKDECLNYALEINEKHGLWGGLSPKGRRRVQR